MRYTSRQLWFVTLLMMSVGIAYSQAPSLVMHRTIDVHERTEVASLCVNPSTQRLYVVGAFADSLMLGGYVLTSRGDVDGFCAALNYNLQVEWVVQFGGPFRDAAKGVTVLPDNSLIVVGYCGANSDASTSYVLGDVTYSGRGDADAVVLRLSHDGMVVWSRNDGGTAADVARSVTSLNDGSLIITGSFTGNARFDAVTVAASESSQHGYMQCLRNNGEQIWVLPIRAMPSTNQSSVTIGRVANVTEDGLCGVVDFTGIVEIGDELINADDVVGQQVLACVETALGIPHVTTVPVCSLSTTAWSTIVDGADGVYSAEADVCSQVATNSLQHVSIATMAHSTLVQGTVVPTHVGAIASDSNGKPVISGVYYGTCIMLNATANSDIQTSNDAGDGMMLYKAPNPSESWITSIHASERSIIEQVQGDRSTLFALALADGAVAELGGEQHAWDQVMILKYQLPVSSVSTDPPRTSNSQHAGPWSDAAATVGVYTVLGDRVSQSPLTREEVLQLPDGVYLLEAAGGLFLCHVGSHDIAFQLSTTAAR